MSPPLKQAVPTKSLAADMVETPKRSEREDRDIQAVATGWIARSFGSAADKFFTAGSRLGQEIQKESKYWEQVLEVKAKGWAVCRLPHERQTLGVQFGMPEAGQLFRDRGLAALRRGQDGSLELDRGPASSEPKALRVSVVKDGQVIGSSALPTSMTLRGTSVEKDILAARDSLFEEELFHELSREARVTASQGVESRQNAIHLPIHDGQRVLIDLVDPDAATRGSGKRGSDTLANAVAVALRIFLLHEHKQKFNRRSHAPRPISDKPRPNPEYLLLRPVLTFLQHTSEVRSIHTFLSSLMPALSFAGLSCNFTQDHLQTLNLGSTPNESTPNGSISASVIDALIAPLESSFSITLPSSKAMQITIRTGLIRLSPSAASLPKTDYSVVPATYPMIMDSYIRPPQLTSLRDLQAFILHLGMLDIVTCISSPGKSAGSTENATEIEGMAKSPSWEIWHFLSGELRVEFPGTGRAKMMVVNVQPDVVRLRYASMNNEIGQKGDDCAYYWSKDRYWKETSEGIEEQGEKLGLLDVVRRAAIYPSGTV